MADQLVAAIDPGIDVGSGKADSSITEMHEYWLAKRGNRPLPLIGELDPLDFPRHLPNVMLVDVKTGPDGEPDFFYRLVGTREVAERGRDPTGKRVAEAYRGPSAEDALACYREVVRTRKPYLDLSTYAVAGRYTRDIGNIFLPFSANGETVSRILVYTAFTGERKLRL